MAVVKDIEIPVGAAFSLTFRWRAPSTVDDSGETVLGAPRDLTGWQGRFIVRDDAATPAKFVGTSYDGGDFTGGVVLGVDPDGDGTADTTNGFVTLLIPDSYTEGLVLPSRYLVELLAPGGLQSRRLLEGKAKAEKAPDLGLGVSWA